MSNILCRIVTINSTALVCFIFLICNVLISTNLSESLGDAGTIYHEGELVGNYWHMLGYYRGTEKFPLLIHGAMDYWPSIAAANVFGEKK